MTDYSKIEELGQRIGDGAARLVAEALRQRGVRGDDPRLEAVSQAMKDAKHAAIDTFLADAKAVPAMAHLAAKTCAMEIALAGIRAL
jgi:hypothetical protein